MPSLALQGIHPFTEEVLVGVVQVKGLAHDLRLLNQINYTLPKGGGSARITVCASREAVVEPERMVELVDEAGLAVEGVFGSAALETYEGGEECLIVARRRP